MRHEDSCRVFLKPTDAALVPGLVETIERCGSRVLGARREQPLGGSRAGCRVDPFGGVCRAGGSLVQAILK